MKWVLILLAVSISDPKDIPGKVTLEMESLEQCQEKLESMSYWLKFKSFAIIGKCEQR